MSEGHARTYSTVEQIRQRFDQDVERFSNLETGQAAAMDSPLCTRLIAQAACAVKPDLQSVLDIGCGAGNYTLVLLQELGRRNVQTTLLDLSMPMLDRAVMRVGQQVDPQPVAMQSDVREVDLGVEKYDIILAAAVLHHLRSDEEWDSVFAKLFASLTPGGWLWIYDMVEHDHPAIHALMRRRYAHYLEGLGGVAYREKVYDYVAMEDTPRSLADQLARMSRAGFVDAVVLHKTGCFAAFGAMKPGC